MVMFVLRSIQHGSFCDVSGNPSKAPIVYRIPAQFFAEHIPKDLPGGVTWHPVRLTNADTYAINAEYKGEGKWILRTGNLLSK